MGRDVIIACDFNSKEEVINFLGKFKEEKPFVKIGMELFYAEGPEIVRTIKQMGHKIFLDLKLHDIPNTVKKAMSVLSGLDVDMCNVHAAGTKAMMQAAIEGLTREDGTRPLLIASVKAFNASCSSAPSQTSSISSPHFTHAPSTLNTLFAFAVPPSKVNVIAELYFIASLHNIPAGRK